MTSDDRDTLLRAWREDCRREARRQYTEEQAAPEATTRRAELERIFGWSPIYPLRVPVRFQHVYLTLRVWCEACDVDLPIEWVDDVVPCPVCRRTSTMQLHVRGVKLLWLKAV